MSNVVDIIEKMALIAAERIVDLLNHNTEKLIGVDKTYTAHKFILNAATLEYVITDFLMGFEKPWEAIDDFFIAMKKGVGNNINSYYKYREEEASRKDKH